MKVIAKYIDQNKVLSKLQLFDILEWVGEQGDIIIYTIDGRERKNSYFVAILSYDMSFDPIRSHASSLQKGVKSVFKEYQKINEKLSKTKHIGSSYKKSTAWVEKFNSPVKQYSSLSKEEAFDIFEQIGNRGDIIFYKKDGPRKENKYTVVIASGNALFEPIRFDTPSLQEGITKVLKEYQKVRPELFL